MDIMIEVAGWIASVLIVGAYFFNIRGRLSAQSPLYQWSNLLGGVLFVLNTTYHHAYPSALVNVIWVVIAVASLVTARHRKLAGKEG
jgi:hypothetical protein